MDSLKKRPHLRVVAFDKCNFRCNYCPPWGENLYSPNKPIETKKLIDIIKILSRNGISDVKITGGEPTLSPDIKIIIKTCVSHFKNCALITNGWNLENTLNDFESLGLKNIEVSLDAFDEIEFNEITLTKKFYKKTMNAINLVANSSISLQINTVMMKGNTGQVHKIINFCEKLGNTTLKLLELVYYEYPGFKFWKDNYISTIDFMDLRYKNKDQYWLHPPGDFGNKMKVYKLSNNAKVLVKDGRVKTMYSSRICLNCKFYPCQNGLYGLHLTYDGYFQFCKHRPDLDIFIDTTSLESIQKSVFESLDIYDCAFISKDEFQWDFLKAKKIAQNLEPEPKVIKWYRGSLPK